MSRHGQLPPFDLAETAVDAHLRLESAVYQGEKQWLVLTRLLWIEPLWLALLAPLVLLPGTLLPTAQLPYCIAALFAFWPLRLLQRRARLTGSAIDPYLMGLLLWLPLPMWLAQNRGAMWESLGYLLYGITLAVALVQWPPFGRKPIRLVQALLVFSAGLALAAPSLTLTAPAKLFQLRIFNAATVPALRTLGESVNPNVLAGALVAAAPLALALLLARRPHRRGKRAGRLSNWRSRLGQVGHKIAYTLLFGLIGAGVLYTQSRGAYLGLAAAAWTVCTLHVRRWQLPIGLLGALLFTLAIRFGANLFFEQAVYVGSVNSFAGRMEVWGRAWAALQDFPITGLGLGMFSELIPRLYPYPTFGPNAHITHAHNVLLQVAIDLGLPGLISYVGITVTTCMWLIQTIRTSPNQRTYSLAAGALGSMVAIQVHGIFDAVLWSSKVGWVSWLPLVLAVLVHRPPRHKNVEREKNEKS